jgi:hypothetical protein
MQNSNPHMLPPRVAHGVCSEAANEDLRRRIVNTLYAQRIPGANSLGVETKAGFVVVCGRLPSSRDRRRCVELCRRVAGVITFTDKLEVDSEACLRSRDSLKALEQPQ